MATNEPEIVAIPDLDPELAALIDSKVELQVPTFLKSANRNENSHEIENNANSNDFVPTTDETLTTEVPEEGNPWQLENPYINSANIVQAEDGNWDWNPDQILIPILISGSEFRISGLGIGIRALNL